MIRRLQLTLVAFQSAAELVEAGHVPTRFALHPDDAASVETDMTLLGLPVILDPARRPGLPVAEVDFR